MWPAPDELWLAEKLGHKPDERSFSCSCGWKHKSPAQLTPRVQTANHIWTFISSEWRSMQQDREEYIKSRFKYLISDRKAISLANSLGHRSKDTNSMNDSCTGCDWKKWITAQDWITHAHEIATKALKELDEFEQSLRRPQ